MSRKNVYKGFRIQEGGPAPVYVNDQPLPLRQDLRNKSEGFQWGYHGSGPAQLSLAILAYEYDDEKATKYYQKFKDSVIARMEGDVWSLTSEQIDYAIERIDDLVEKGEL